MATLLSSEAIQSKLAQLPDWTLDGKTITCTRNFKDFVAAVDFVNRLVEPAEAAGHHPDLSISYNRVIIQLTTHDAGGLTEKDFALAETISRLH
ncbi:MAG TPA: 4a-hydroxytetrahydrobiopterin dehydratase [Leptolyngbyaceae cyanobacterium M65_K2018_010]|nr:4a-hydroxytetrahydrobiopterin dehydratase [Leptolyngbyaceae cyanobacterium M65_K2018_010]